MMSAVMAVAGCKVLGSLLVVTLDEELVGDIVAEQVVQDEADTDGARMYFLFDFGRHLVAVKDWLGLLCQTRRHDGRMVVDFPL